MIYINRTAKNVYVELDNALDPESNFIGETWEDFNNGAWLLLSNELIKFHEENIKASVKEVWEMYIPEPPTPIVRTAKMSMSDMYRKIDLYDRSNNVNGFTVNNTIEGWFTILERNNYKSSIDAAKLLGVQTLSFYIKDTMLEVSTTLAEQMLAMIQLYADQCYIVTKLHKLAIELIYISEFYSEEEKISLIDSYDFTANYPNKLNFEL